jgi:flagellar hook-associated protein 1
MSLLQIGVSGLQAYQTSLSTTGHNIANANTAGYSRQEVMLESALPQYQGYGYVGAGVNIQDVRRLSDDFLTDQLRGETQSYQGFDTWKNNIEQINRLLSTESTGVGPVINRFFSALQGAADNPASVPAREVLLGESNSMAERFNAIGQNFKDQNEVLSGQLKAMTNELNALASSVAELNGHIIFYRGDPTREQPNDLLDQRDEMIRRMSEITKVSVSEEDGLMNVFIGNGQSMVQGLESSKLTVVNGVSDPSQVDIRFSNQTSDILLTEQLKSGGQIGGTLNFRDESLNPAIASLGRLAMAVSSEMNNQHSLGIDMSGEFGNDFFTDINDPFIQRQRVQSYNSNTQPNNGILSVSIDDMAAITTDEYKVDFIGPNNFNYEITRVGNDEFVTKGSLSGEYPDTISFEGLTLTFEQGSFTRDDEFLIQPTRQGSTDIKTQIVLPSEIALASPIKAQTGLGNLGSGKIDQGIMLSRASEMFANAGELAPPLLVRFDSEDRYSILDNTDPSRPKDLDPPMSNLVYEPGGNLFPWKEGETQVSSFSPVLAGAPFLQRMSAAEETPGNGFNPEVMDFNQYDDNGKLTSTIQVTTPANASAAQIAAQMNTVLGVEARASTSVELTNFTSAAGTSYTPANPMDVWINGYQVTEDDLASGQTIYLDGYAEEIPDPMTPDFIANRINHHGELSRSGVSAKSDGETLTITDKNGNDITVEMSGDAGIYPGGALTGTVGPISTGTPINVNPGDSFEISNGEQYDLSVFSGNTRGYLTEKAGFDFSQNGPYQYEFDIPGGPSGLVELNGSHATGEEVIAEIESQVDKLLTAPGRSVASIDELGNVSFKIVTPMQGHSTDDREKMTIGGKVDAVLPENMTLSTVPPYGKVFEGTPVASPMFMGFEFIMEGRPEGGDTFTIDFNQDGSSDNRNALALAALAMQDLVNSREGGMTFTEAYSQVVEQIGTKTRELQVRTEAAEGSLESVFDQIAEVSGVNLDEEAARLIQYENAYNATAQIIKIAQETFNTLLSSF